MAPDIEAILRAVLKAGLDTLPAKTARVQSLEPVASWEATSTR